MPKKAAKSSAAPQTLTVPIEYIKSQVFRVVHADGAIGSVTPSGNVHIAFYSERPAIPRMMVHPRLEHGSLGDPIPEQTIVRPGLIREMDVDVVLSPKAVNALIDWLTVRRDELQKYAVIEKHLEAASKTTRGKKH